MEKQVVILCQSLKNEAKIIIPKLMFKLRFFKDSKEKIGKYF